MFVFTVLCGSVRVFGLLSNVLLLHGIKQNAKRKCKRKTGKFHAKTGKERKMNACVSRKRADYVRGRHVYEST